MRKGVEMINRKLIKETIDRRMKEYEKYQKFKDKEELDNVTRVLVAQVEAVKKLNIINITMANEYLVRLQKRYIV